MKTIQPIKVWKDGKVLNATIIDIYISYDDLSTQAAFQYTLFADDFTYLVNDKVDMKGQDYENWDDSNGGAYDFVASVLNLTITGNYIPPAPPTDTIVE
jgi:hypothetical protein